MLWLWLVFIGVVLGGKIAYVFLEAKRFLIFAAEEGNWLENFNWGFWDNFVLFYWCPCSKVSYDQSYIVDAYKDSIKFGYTEGGILMMHEEFFGSWFGYFPLWNFIDFRRVWILMNFRINKAIFYWISGDKGSCDSVSVSFNDLWESQWCNFERVYFVFVLSFTSSSWYQNSFHFFGLIVSCYFGSMRFIIEMTFWVGWYVAYQIDVFKSGESLGKLLVRFLVEDVIHIPENFFRKSITAVFPDN